MALLAEPIPQLGGALREQPRFGSGLCCCRELRPLLAQPSWPPVLTSPARHALQNPLEGFSPFTSRGHVLVLRHLSGGFEPRVFRANAYNARRERSQHGSEQNSYPNPWRKTDDKAWQPLRALNLLEDVTVPLQPSPVP